MTTAEAKKTPKKATPKKATKKVAAKATPKKEKSDGGDDGVMTLESGAAELVADLIDVIGEVKGGGRAQLLGDASAIALKGVISTQVPSLNAAIGRGGVPWGRLTCITGGEGGGKTTALLHMIAECRAMGGLAVLAEKENKLDDSIVKAIGIDGGVILAKPPYLEKLFELIEHTARKVREIRESTGRVIPCIIGVDSIDGFDTKAEMEAKDGWEDKSYAGTASVMSRNLAAITEIIEEESIALVVIAQERERVGITYGKKTQMTGGKALRFHACLILEVTTIGKVKEGERAIGSRVQVICTKNQIASPFGKAEYDVIWGKGVDIHGDLLEHGAKLGVITKKGSNFYLDDLKICNGVRAARSVLRSNPDLYEDIRARVADAEATRKLADAEED